MEHAWHSIALEERIEVVVGAKVKALFAALLYLLALGCIAWGYDKFSILAWGSAGVFVFVPLISNQLWQKIQSDLILRTLAARAVAKDFAETNGIRSSVKMIFKGSIHLMAPDVNGNEKSKFSLSPTDFLSENVWIALVQGGVVVFAEREGGPVLRFISSAKAEMVVRRPNGSEELAENSLVLVSAGPHRGLKAAISSPYRGAMYVFEKKLGAMISGVK